MASKVTERLPPAANRVSSKALTLPSGLVERRTNGRGGIPVGPISVAAPVPGLTVYKLLLTSVAYIVPPSLARLFAEVGPQGEAGDVQSPNPVGPMTEVTPVAGLIESRLPEKVRVSRDPFGPGTNPSPPSGVLGPI